MPYITALQQKVMHYFCDTLLPTLWMAILRINTWTERWIFKMTHVRGGILYQKVIALYAVLKICLF